jgi:hypothetical protein
MRSLKGLAPGILREADIARKRKVVLHRTEFLRTTGGALIRKSEFRSCH